MTDLRVQELKKARKSATVFILVAVFGALLTVAVCALTTATLGKNGDRLIQFVTTAEAVVGGWIVLTVILLFLVPQIKTAKFFKKISLVKLNAIKCRVLAVGQTTTSADGIKVKGVVVKADDKTERIYLCPEPTAEGIVVGKKYSFSTALNYILEAEQADE